MRHRRATKKLSRNTSNRKALLRSLVTNLMLHERISTTHKKAKEASSLADRLITQGKQNTITSKKNVISMLGSKSLINKLFEDIAPRFMNRKGGYTRILRLAPRKGDGAPMAILELTERKVIEKPKVKKKGKQQKEKEGAVKLEKKEKGAAGKPEKPKEEKPHTPMPSKEAPIKTKEKFDEEKGKEKAKSEKDKLKKGFLKGLRRYFRGKAT